MASSIFCSSMIPAQALTFSARGRRCRCCRTPPRRPCVSLHRVFLPLLHLRNEYLLRVEHLMDEAELFPGRGESFAGNATDVKIEMAHLPDLLRGLPRMAGIEVDAARLPVEPEHPGRADHRGGPAAKGGAVKLLPMHELPARPLFNPP